MANRHTVQGPMARIAAVVLALLVCGWLVVSAHLEAKQAAGRAPAGNGDGVSAPGSAEPASDPPPYWNTSKSAVIRGLR